jgi:hypothetical protein
MSFNKHLNKIITEYINFELKFRNELLNNTEQLGQKCDNFWSVRGGIIISDRFYKGDRIGLFAKIVNRDNKWYIKLI